MLSSISAAIPEFVACLEALSGRLRHLLARYFAPIDHETRLYRQFTDETRAERVRCHPGTDG